jgi:erythronate-4-phosphate dehydrogenase
VVEYVLSALAAVDDVLERLLAGGCVGIVGLGNVGGRLLRRLQRLGIRAIGHDPLLTDTLQQPLHSLEEVLAADVVSLHTPLTRSGPFPTWHLLDANALAQLQPAALLINSGRGAVIDNPALAQLLARRCDLRVVLDVWEGEPAIDAGLLSLVRLGTPHIAGYSSDGKLAGVRMVLTACYRYLGLAPPPLPAAEPAPPLRFDSSLRGVALLRAALLGSYDIREDDRQLRLAYANGGAVAFDALRRDYAIRRELGARAVAGWSRLDREQRQLLKALGLGEKDSEGR